MNTTESLKTEETISALESLIEIVSEQEFALRFCLEQLTRIDDVLAEHELESPQWPQDRNIDLNELCLIAKKALPIPTSDYQRSCLRDLMQLKNTLANANITEIKQLIEYIERP